MTSAAEWVAAERPPLPLESIRHLYIDRNGTLWGIPYSMRPGQSPRDLLGIVSVADQLRGETRYAKREPSALGWDYLGSVNDRTREVYWWGSYNMPRLAEVKVWLATLTWVPGGFPEHGPVEYAVDLREEAAHLIWPP